MAYRISTLFTLFTLIITIYIGLCLSFCGYLANRGVSKTALQISAISLDGIVLTNAYGGHVNLTFDFYDGAIRNIDYAGMLLHEKQARDIMPGIDSLVQIAGNLLRDNPGICGGHVDTRPKPRVENATSKAYHQARIAFDKSNMHGPQPSMVDYTQFAGYRAIA